MCIIVAVGHVMKALGQMIRAILLVKLLPYNYNTRMDMNLLMAVQRSAMLVRELDTHGLPVL